MRLGPFWRRRPSAATTTEDWAWCWIYMNDRGDVNMIEWL